MRILLALVCYPLCAIFTGCSVMPWNKEDDPSRTVDAEPVEIDWKLSSESPPTYLPAGYDSSQPTDAFHGSWIVDHESGTRYFVPKGGTDHATASQITRDALSRSSGPSAVGEVIDKTKSLGSSAAGKVATGIDKITPKFGKKDEGAPSS